MKKFSTGMALGFAAVVAGWCIYRWAAIDRQVDRGEVIFSNSPAVG